MLRGKFGTKTTYEPRRKTGNKLLQAQWQNSRDHYSCDFLSVQLASLIGFGRHSIAITMVGHM